MKYVTLAAIVSCLVFGSNIQGQVPSDVAANRYDIGLLEAEVVPAEYGDVLVVIGAKWCGPCMRMYPQWKTLRAQGYRVVYIDYDRPTYKNDDDKAIVEKFSAMRDKSVPDVYVYNTDTDKIVRQWHQYVGIKTIKDYLWKPSSSTGLVPELRR